MVVVVVVPVVVVVVDVVVVVLVVVFEHPPKAGVFQARGPLPEAIQRHSPWQSGDTTTGPPVVVVVTVDSTISSGRSFIQVPFLCRQTWT